VDDPGHDQIFPVTAENPEEKIFRVFMLFPFVFLPGGQATPDVTFPFILIQHLPDLAVQSRAAPGQAGLQILMYRGFGDSEVLRRRADGGSGFNHVHSQFAGALLHGIVHRLPPMLCAAETRICGKLGRYEP
jgi:hypothetical protein